jgi:hypothetical protein
MIEGIFSIKKVGGDEKSGNITSGEEAAFKKIAETELQYLSYNLPVNPGLEGYALSRKCTT